MNMMKAMIMITVEPGANFLKKIPLVILLAYGLWTSGLYWYVNLHTEM